MVIGLTGGIGAGKSAVMEYLQEKGCYTILADDVARKLQEKGGVNMSIAMCMLVCYLIISWLPLFI